MDRDVMRIELELGALTRRVADTAKLLPALIAENGFRERRRLIACLRARRELHPKYRLTPTRVPAWAWRALDGARNLARRHPAENLYLARLEELELELRMIEVLGHDKQVRRLALRRFGNGNTEVLLDDGPVTLRHIADEILTNEKFDRQEAILPAEALPGEPSFAELIRKVAAYAGIEVEVRVEPRLPSSAAAGDRVVFIQDRCFAAREALRLAVHEVLGHLVAAANGRAQPMKLLEIGTADAFVDQEGIALWLEEHAGLMDGLRRRTLAARVVAADRMHEGAPFGRVVRELHNQYGFEPQEAVAIAERAYRGGGVARDVGYLQGFLRVRQALGKGETTVDELRSGRVSLDALPELRRLASEGWFRDAVYRPSLAYSLAATGSGTSPEMSPPSEATSFTSVELT